MESKYSELMSNTDLYASSLVTIVAGNHPFWESLSPRNKEHHLRKAQVCISLCNSRRHEDPEPPAKKKARLEGESVASSSSSDDPDKDKYAWYPLYGLNDRDLLALEELPPDTWDILYKNPERSSPLRVNLSKQRDIQFAMEAAEEIVVDPISCEIYCEVYTPPGVDQTITWLQSRRHLLHQMNAIVDATDYDGPLQTLIFRDSNITGWVTEWVERFWSLRMLRCPTNITQMPKMVVAQMEKYVQGIEDPRLRDSPQAKWNGKLLPNICLEFSPLIGNKSDSERVADIIRSIPNLERGGPNTDGYNVLRWLASFRNLSELRSQNIAEVHQVPEVIQEILGINKKGATRDEMDTTTRQPEMKSPEHASYPKWIEPLLQDLASKSVHDKPYDWTEDGNTLWSEHPLAGIGVEITSGLLDIFFSSNCAVSMAVAMGFYSRIGGAYKSNKNVSVMPLTYRDRNDIRHTCGLAIIPPFHARKAGDKMNFFTIELVAPYPRCQKYAKAMFKGEIIHIDNKTYACRRNAIFKEDPPYGCFLGSSLFVVANTLGEMCLQSAAEGGVEVTRELSQQLVTTHRFWVSERITESFAMGILGRSQEEGAIAILRKIYLIMYAQEKGRQVFTYDVAGLCDKINECTINSPLEMYWVCAFLDTMRALCGQQR